MKEPFRESFEFTAAQLSAIFGSVSTEYYVGSLSREVHASVNKMYEQQLSRETVTKTLESPLHLVPMGQSEPARQLLQHSLSKELGSRQELSSSNFKDAMDSIAELVEDDKDVQGASRAQALQKAAKEGKLDKKLDELELDAQELLTQPSALEEILSGGISAATLSFILNIAPAMIDAISLLVQRGEIDMQQLKREGFSALEHSARSFILGSLSAGVTVALHSGTAGNSLQYADAVFIGSLVALAYAAIENAFDVAAGRMTRAQYAQSLLRDAYISGFSMAGGYALQGMLGLPYFLGSLIGSAVGGFAYTLSERVYLSYCVESGVTFFGLVDQDYEMSEELLQQMGLPVFDEETIKLQPFEYQSFDAEAFHHEGFEFERVNISVVRRGVIGVFNIGYI